MSVAPAGSPLLPIRTSCWLELDAASSSENGDPAATVNALPSLGVGVCQESVRLGPRACPAPAPTATSSTSTESSPHAAPARRKRLLMVSVCQQNNGPPAERRSGLAAAPSRAFVVRRLAGEGRPSEIDAPRPSHSPALAPDALLALGALRLRLLVLIPGGGLVKSGHAVPVNNTRGLLDRLSGSGRGVREPAHRSKRREHAGGKRAGEGDSERAGPRVAAVLPDASLELVQELAAWLRAVCPEL